MQKINLYRMNKPNISIILPTYNRGYILERAILSVIDQSISDWELIVVDDGSGDNTFNLVNSFIESYDQIKYIKHKNRKLPISLNTGIRIASGSYITFIGSDDEYKKNHLELRYDFMLSNPAVDLIHGGVEIIGDEFVKDFNNMQKKIHLSECVIGGTIFSKRAVFDEDFSFPDIPYGEDYVFIQGVEKRFSIYKVDFPTYIYYRDTADAICNNI